LGSAFSFFGGSSVTVNRWTVSRLFNEAVVLPDGTPSCSPFCSVPCDLKVSSGAVVEGGRFVDGNLFVENGLQVQAGVGATGNVIVGRQHTMVLNSLISAVLHVAHGMHPVSLLLAQFNNHQLRRTAESSDNTTAQQSAVSDNCFHSCQSDLLMISSHGPSFYSLMGQSNSKVKHSRLSKRVYGGPLTPDVAIDL
jgi:hypothetical protein